MGRPSNAQKEADFIPSHWVYPTLEEIKNGWDIRSLNKYLEDRKMAQLKDVSEPRQAPRPEVQNHKYNIW